MAAPMTGKRMDNIKEFRINLISGYSFANTNEAEDQILWYLLLMRPRLMIELYISNRLLYCRDIQLKTLT